MLRTLYVATSSAKLASRPRYPDVISLGFWSAMYGKTTIHLTRPACCPDFSSCPDRRNMSVPNPRCMQSTRKRLLIAIPTILLTVYFAIASISCHRLAVANNASRSIRSIDISVCNQIITVIDLKTGKTQRRRFHSDGSDSSIHVSVTFSDGSTMMHTDGYVTTGGIVGERCSIKITDDRISIEQ